ncbi:hypothetical protein CORC01_13917 [Colletotrichum orchidophilum]|uniref:Helicase C-terminal domain-containing protein n=1 Tax=Colletotrichum orchidophilum TaxID=1209926 RepID=A0A1G4ANP2_9PEZI|nr:uncharacterized protein CORC01_13917 [Colletotrichum orchidophilum]OHE90777.1 hypothetical protein CORC01_13917 [Colletotrichum orchidophilum]
MLRLGDLTEKICPRRVFITATLPPSREADFKRAYKIGPDPTVIRTTTNRPNISYRHLLVEEESELLFIAATDFGSPCFEYSATHI